MKPAGSDSIMQLRMDGGPRSRCPALSESVVEMLEKLQSDEAMLCACVATSTELSSPTTSSVVGPEDDLSPLDPCSCRRRLSAVNSEEEVLR